MRTENEIKENIELLRNLSTQRIDGTTDLLAETKRVMQLWALLWVLEENECLDM